MLVVEGLDAYYDEIRALAGVALAVAGGQFVTVAGPNGAGKSTLMNCLAGLHRQKKGRIALLGREIGHLEAEEIDRVALVPEGRELFTGLTVKDNLLLGAYRRLKREGKKTVLADLDRVVATFPPLQDRLDFPVEELSGGMQQMVAIGRGLMSDPQLILLDEPSLGLAPLVVREIFHQLKELARQGKAVLVAEQNLAACMLEADFIYILDQGRVTAASPPTAELRANSFFASFLR